MVITVPIGEPGIPLQNNNFGKFKYKHATLTRRNRKDVQKYSQLCGAYTCKMKICTNPRKIEFLASHWQQLQRPPTRSTVDLITISASTEKFQRRRTTRRFERAKGTESRGGFLEGGISRRRGQRYVLPRGYALQRCRLGRFEERGAERRGTLLLALCKHVAKVRGDVSPKVTTIPRRRCATTATATPAVAREPATERSRCPAASTFFLFALAR